MLIEHLTETDAHAQFRFSEILRVGGGGGGGGGGVGLGAAVVLWKANHPYYTLDITSLGTMLVALDHNVFK